MEIHTTVLAEKLLTMTGELYEASNGVRLVLASDGETVWFAVPGTHHLNDTAVCAAIDEFMSK